MKNPPRIVGGKITTVAVPLDGVLLHSDGAEPALQLRHVIELETDCGVTGLGEVGPRVRPEQLAAALKTIHGLDVFSLETLRLRLQSEKFYRMDLATMAAGFQMACLDAHGKFAGVRVGDLLGGVVREEIPMIAYIFRKEATEYGGAVRSNDEVVSHTRDLVERHGFRTLKLKAAAVAPEEDVKGTLALREAFPELKLRLDPNGAWSVATALGACRQLEGVGLEWLEDPVLTVDGMAEIARRTSIPLGTNMCCIQPRDFPYAVATRAINVMLLDLWYLGGPWSAKQMAAACGAFGVDLGVHAGGGACELGIGLAAELHLAASLPSLVHASDAEYHHLADDVLEGGLVPYHQGSLKVPVGPGLGVSIDRDRLGKYAELYRSQSGLATHSSNYPAYPLW